MRLVLGRVGIPMLVAAAILLIGNLTAARADPARGEETRCDGPVLILPEITAKTCTSYFWWDYRANWAHQAKVTIRNSSAYYTVDVRPDLLIDSAVYVGGTFSIPPGAEREVYGNSVHRLPGTVRKQGRGYIHVVDFATYTYAPPFP